MVLYYDSMSKPYFHTLADIITSDGDLLKGIHTRVAELCVRDRNFRKTIVGLQCYDTDGRVAFYDPVTLCFAEDVEAKRRYKCRHHLLLHKDNVIHIVEPQSRFIVFHEESLNCLMAATKRTARSCANRKTSTRTSHRINPLRFHGTV